MDDVNIRLGRSTMEPYMYPPLVEVKYQAYETDTQFHDELNSNTKYFCSLKFLLFFKISVFYKLLYN
jgi:hypothetical protein